MSCPTGLEATDPAALRNSLTRRIPNVAGNADDFLREAATEFFRRSGVWRNQRLTLNVDTVRTRYELPVPDAGRIVRIAHVWQQRGDDECETEVKLYQETEISSKTAQQEQRWHQPTPRTITFHKLFEADATVRFEAVLTIDRNNIGDESLIEEYREGILAGASKYATMAQGIDTSNRSAGIDYHTMFETAIAEASCKYQQNIGTERAPMSRMQVVLNQREVEGYRRRGYGGSRGYRRYR